MKQKPNLRRYDTRTREGKAWMIGLKLDGVRQEIVNQAIKWEASIASLLADLQKLMGEKPSTVSLLPPPSPAPVTSTAKLRLYTPRSSSSPKKRKPKSPSGK